MKLQDKVRPDAVMPLRAGAVVIGAGIIGISTALELAERGIDVVVVEKGEVAAEQSSRNWGWCRTMGRDPREIPLAVESLKLWRKMNERVGGETGFRPCGIIYLAESDRKFAENVAWHRNHAVPHQLSTRVVAAADIAQLLPGSAKPWAGAIYTADDGRAEPFIAVPTMARALQSRGGKIFTQCAARGVEKTGGRVSAVVTEVGAIKTDTVVLAGGFWSKRFLNNLDLRFPQLGVVNSVMRTAPLEIGVDRTFAGRDFAVRKRMDGGFTVAHDHLSIVDITPASFEHFFDFLPTLRVDWRGLRLRFGKRFFEERRLKRTWALDEASPFESIRVLDPEPDMSVLRVAQSALQDCYPAFRDMRIVESWAGVIDATPDAVPVIDRIDTFAGLFLASGFSGHGFGIGPGAGKLMAQIITGETPCVDPTPFRYGRFTDGTATRPMTGV